MNTETLDRREADLKLELEIIRLSRLEEEHKKKSKTWAEKAKEVRETINSKQQQLDERLGKRVAPTKSARSKNKDSSEETS
tara:strand:+ start:296 stop:538 length:243 start_codon:yes stop_codon:yes gene_type:complete